MKDSITTSKTLDFKGSFQLKFEKKSSVSCKKAIFHDHKLGARPDMDWKKVIKNF